MVFRIIHFCLNQPMLGCVGEPHDDQKYCLRTRLRQLQWLRQSQASHTHKLFGQLKTVRQVKLKQTSAALIVEIKAFKPSLHLTHWHAESVSIGWKNRFATHSLFLRLFFQPLHKAVKKFLPVIRQITKHTWNHSGTDRVAPPSIISHWMMAIHDGNTCFCTDICMTLSPIRFFKTITFGSCQTPPLFVARPHWKRDKSPWCIWLHVKYFWLNLINLSRIYYVWFQY